MWFNLEVPWLRRMIKRSTGVVVIYYGDILSIYYICLRSKWLQKLKSILLKSLHIQSQTYLYHNKERYKHLSSKKETMLPMVVVSEFHDMSLYVCPPRPSEFASSNTAPVGPKSSVSWIHQKQPQKVDQTKHYLVHFQMSKNTTNVRRDMKGLFSGWIKAIHPEKTSALEVVGAAFCSWSQFDGVSTALPFDFSNLP